MGLTHLRRWLFLLCQSRAGQCLEQRPEIRQGENLQP